MSDRELLDGWVITLEGDTAKVVSPPTGPGFAVVCQQARALPERLLFALAESLVRARSAHPPQAERDALRADILFELLSAANYIDTLGGDSKSYRVAIAKAKGERQWLT